MLWRLRAFPDFCEPCLPSPVERPPAGSDWIHEIKHDGFRMMARRDVAGVRLLTRNGNDWTARFPLIAAAVGFLRVKSCLIDGEAVACDGDGLTAAIPASGRAGVSVCVRLAGAQWTRHAAQAIRDAQARAGRGAADQGGRGHSVQ